jgi:hypothetical protein
MSDQNQSTREEIRAIRALGYRHREHRYLHICGTCYHLYERSRPDLMDQACQCSPRDEKRWPRYDFNERAILCRCCGLEVIDSGSRWSSYFCRECQLLATGVSVWQRQLVFPIGRHTMMHTWVPGSRTPTLKGFGVTARASGRLRPAAATEGPRYGDEFVQTVYESIGFVSRGSEGLWEWYRQVMHFNYGRLGISADVTLRDYMLLLSRKELGFLNDRLLRFEGLCEFFKSAQPQNSPQITRA